MRLRLLYPSIPIADCQAQISHSAGAAAPVISVGATLTLIPNPDRLIVFGGIGPNYEILSQFHMYDLAVNTWRRLEAGTDYVGTLPEARESHSAVVWVDNEG